MSEVQYVVGALGYFVIVGVLLSMAGLPDVGVLLPDVATGTDQDDGLGARVDCIRGFQWFCNLGSFTINAVQTISDVLTYAAAFLFFFFQLLTYQLPIPFWLNSMIVLPPAIALIYIGIRFARGGG